MDVSIYVMREREREKEIDKRVRVCFLSVMFDEKWMFYMKILRGLKMLVCLCLCIGVNGETFIFGFLK